MMYSTNIDNQFMIEGNVTKVNVFAEGKVANVVVAVKGNTKEHDTYISVKSFNPKSFNQLNVGMKVRIVGYIGSSSYKDKEGNIKYKDNNDLIVTTIKIHDYKPTRDSSTSEETNKSTDDISKNIKTVEDAKVI